MHACMHACTLTRGVESLVHLAGGAAAVPGVGVLGHLQVGDPVLDVRGAAVHHVDGLVRGKVADVTCQ
jgi:hypothetical protein